MIFAFAAVPMMGAAGLGIEFTRYSMINENMVASLDAAGLAIQRRADELGYDANQLTEAQRTELKAYGEEFFFANFRFSEQLDNLDVNFVMTSTNITPKACGDLDTMMLGLLDVESFDICAQTQITLRGAGKLELALVLDVTGSMSYSASGSSDSRMEVLKEAVYTMMDSLYGLERTSTNDNVKVGVVPFNTIVNTGGRDVMEDDWLDLDAESHWHGNSFFHVEDPFDIDLTQKVNLFELFDSIGSKTSSTSDDGVWKGCVEARPFPLDELVSPPTDQDISASFIDQYDNLDSEVEIDDSVYTDVFNAFSQAPDLPYSASYAGRAENTRFVPFFYPDHSDCSYDACNYYAYGSSAPGYAFDSVSYESDYENRHFVRDYQYTHIEDAEWSDFYKYFQIACQFRFSLNGSRTAKCDDYFEDELTDDPAWDVIAAKAEVTGNILNEEEKIRQFYPGTYNPTTNLYEGKYDLTVYIDEDQEVAYSGPNRDCSTPLLPLSTKKDEVLDTIDAMTPRGATNTAIGTIWGWRLLTQHAPFTEAVDLAQDSDWRKAIVIMTDGQNNVGGRWRTINGSDFEAYGYLNDDRLNLDADEGDYEKEFNNKTIRMCHRMQAAGIRVFTVGFAISSGSGADKMLKACASVPEDTDEERATYYLASNADQLKDAFESITEDLVLLHISQ